MEDKDLDLIYLRQPYSITRAQDDFNVPEQRIMFRITEALQGHMKYDKDRSQVQIDLLGNPTLILATKDLVPSGDHNYEAVKRALASLRKKPIIIKGKDEKGDYKIETSPIMRYKYHYNSGKVEVLLDKDLLPCYLALAKQYSRYLLNVAFNFSSTYAMKLYQFVSHWKEKRAIEVKVEELREWLQLGNKYEYTRDLRKYVLEPAEKELKQRADVWFDIEELIKEGKRIVGWKLRISQKGVTPADDNIDYTASAIKLLKGPCRLSPNQLQELEPILSRPELHKPIFEKLGDVAKQVNKKKVKDLASYTIKTLKNEFSGYFNQNGKKTPLKP